MKFFISLIASLLASHANAASSTVLVLKPPFFSQLTGKKAIYRCEEGVSEDIFWSIAFQTPNPIGPAVAAVIDSFVEFSSSDAEEIAKSCKSTFSNTFDQIGCISIVINLYFKDKKFKGLNSFCRSHAAAFNRTFAKLGIPRSNSSTFSIFGKMGSFCTSAAHVLNRVSLIGTDEKPYTYAIDSGWFPGAAFPLTEITARYHKTSSEFPDLIDSQN